MREPDGYKQGSASRSARTSFDGQAALSEGACLLRANIDEEFH
jgi:hypothetical protein